MAVDAFPNVVEAEDNNTPDKAQRVAPPTVVNGQCGGGDVDYYRDRFGMELDALADQCRAALEALNGLARLFPREIGRSGSAGL